MFWQQVANGLSLGSVYALVAVGYSLVYSILELINFAHGEVFMLGAFITLTLVLDAASGFVVYADRTLDITPAVLTELAAQLQAGGAH